MCWKGHGCWECAKKLISNSKKKDIKDTLNEFVKIHGNKYDYSLVEYNGTYTKVMIICVEHGKFEQTPKSHISGHGCPKCAGNKKDTTYSFVEKSKIIHDDKYDYINVDYKNALSKVIIKCDKHGTFETTPNNHLSKSTGCPKCVSYKGETKVRNILEKNNIIFEEQYSFDDCINIRKLKFDFYLSEYNTLIEYDGKQHFTPNEFFGGYKGFEETKKRDYIKNEYCEKEGINLIRIPYFEMENIEEIIQNFIKQYTKII